MYTSKRSINQNLQHYILHIYLSFWILYPSFWTAFVQVSLFEEFSNPGNPLGSDTLLYAFYIYHYARSDTSSWIKIFPNSDFRFLISASKNLSSSSTYLVDMQQLLFNKNFHQKLIRHIKSIIPRADFQVHF